MKKFSLGFTLIELFIVVAIIGIILAIAIPGFMEYKCRSTGDDYYCDNYQKHYSNKPGYRE